MLLQAVDQKTPTVMRVDRQTSRWDVDENWSALRAAQGRSRPGLGGQDGLAPAGAKFVTTSMNIVDAVIVLLSLGDFLQRSTKLQRQLSDLSPRW